MLPAEPSRKNIDHVAGFEPQRESPASVNQRSQVRTPPLVFLLGSWWECLAQRHINKTYASWFIAQYVPTFRSRCSQTCGNTKRCTGSYRFRYEIERHFRKNTSYCKLGKCCIPTGDVFGSNVSFQLSRNKSKAVLKQDSKMNQGILRYPQLSLCFLICFILSGCIHRISTIDY